MDVFESGEGGVSSMSRRESLRPIRSAFETLPGSGTGVFLGGEDKTGRGWIGSGTATDGRACTWPVLCRFAFFSFLAFLSMERVSFAMRSKSTVSLLLRLALAFLVFFFAGSSVGFVAVVELLKASPAALIDD